LNIRKIERRESPLLVKRRLLGGEEEREKNTREWKKREE